MDWARNQQGGCELVQRRMGVAANDGGVKVEGLGGDEPQFLGELVNAVGLGADQAMFASNETEKGGQLEIAECVDFIEKLFLFFCHCHGLHLLVAVAVSAQAMQGRKWQRKVGMRRRDCQRFGSDPELHSLLAQSHLANHEPGIRARG